MPAEELSLEGIIDTQTFLLTMEFLMEKKPP